MMKCHDCPNLAREGACLGEETPRLCELKRSDPAYVELVAGRVTLIAGPPATADDLKARIERCPQRVTEGCGCGGAAKCRLEKAGPGELVTLEFCRLCLAEDQPEGEPQATAGYPSLARQAGNLAVAAARFVGSGLATAAEATVAARLAACRSCDRFDAGPERCRECGCFVALKAKIASEACPIGKW